MRAALNGFEGQASTRSATADAILMQSEAFKVQGYPRGTRDKQDLSYNRPLTLGFESAGQ